MCLSSSSVFLDHASGTLVRSFDRVKAFGKMSDAPQRVDDPGLPSPWQKLYDPKTKYSYYWNPNTNETTYDRPAAPPPAAGGGGSSGFDLAAQMAQVG